MHERLDDVADCLREHGADIPGVSVRGHGVSLQVPRAQAEAITKRVAKECGMPPPPPPGKVFPLTRKQMEKGRKAITRGDCPPLPPALPRRK